MVDAGREWLVATRAVIEDRHFPAAGRESVHQVRPDETVAADD
jgi:hypothetical protein